MMKFHPDVLAAHAQFGGDLESMQRCYEWYDLKADVASLRSRAENAEAELLIHRLGHDDHIYEALQALFDRGRAAGGFDGETQNLIRELTNAMRDAANWRAETKISLGLEQQMRKAAEATCEKLAQALELANGRITLLLQEFPETSDKSDHPCATKYVLKKVRGALSEYRKEASE